MLSFFPPCFVPAASFSLSLKTAANAAAAITIYTTIYPQPKRTLLVPITDSYILIAHDEKELLRAVSDSRPDDLDQVYLRLRGPLPHSWFPEEKEKKVRPINDAYKQTTKIESI